ncbi:MAG: polyisoprenoid-binding protein YceI [Cyclobacteriaceae bacterium]|jgi:polyisoprenoid-binding protein YceI
MKYNVLLSILIIFLFSCKQKKSSPEIDIPAKSIVAYPNADTLKVDLNKSVITWIGSKPTTQHDGIIELDNGLVIIDNNQLIGGFVSININTLKVMDINPSKEEHKKLTDHLMSVDFFDVLNYPKGAFEIISIKPYDSTYHFERKEIVFPSKNQPATAASFAVREPNVVILGNLTIKDVTEQITFPANVEFKTSLITIEAKFNLDRTKWNLAHNDESSIIDKAKDKFIYNTVNVGFLIEAPLTE